MALTVATIALVAILTNLKMPSAFCWSNGGYSADPFNPDYGTHDWIVQHALDWLPTAEKQYILDNLAAFLYGTELPDRPSSSGGIGDTTNHHIYFHSDGTLQDDASAVRAQEEYENAVEFANGGDLASAVKRLGAVVHYICDVAVFGHVMGSSTDWGSETHHSDYENHVNAETGTYTSEFDVYLVFDGALSIESTYHAAIQLANDTTFDPNGDLTALWMDQNCDWTNAAFKDRAGESLSLAANAVADILHTFYVDHVIPELPRSMILPLFTVLTLLAVLCSRRMRIVTPKRQSES
jgi:hypothetical protein